MIYHLLSRSYTYKRMGHISLMLSKSTSYFFISISLDLRCLLILYLHPVSYPNWPGYSYTESSHILDLCICREENIRFLVVFEVMPLDVKIPEYTWLAKGVGLRCPGILASLYIVWSKELNPFLKYPPLFTTILFQPSALMIYFCEFLLFPLTLFFKIFNLLRKTSPSYYFLVNNVVMSSLYSW